MAEGERIERAGAGRAGRTDPVAGRTIGEHGIVGDLDTVALVALDGTVDFMCWPCLDAPSIFAGLLDPERGGAFELAPVLDGARPSQLYVPGTNVLATRWRAPDGGATVLDLMPHPDAAGALAGALIRRVEAVRGRVRLRARCRPRPDYARLMPVAEADGARVTFRTEAGPGLALWSTVPLSAAEGEASSDFTLAEGEAADFVLLDAERRVPDVVAVRAAIEGTLAAWRRWSRASTYRGRWRDEVERSALALKLLTSRRHGSIAAAATFGLPEVPGGERNWDYRATWIRDAAFTVYAFLRLGYAAEAEHFQHWLGASTRVGARRDRLRVLYALDGSDPAGETVLDHLAGHGGARPVRVGNAAREQEQLDIYGELLDGVYLINKYGRAISRDGWMHVLTTVDHVCRVWREADSGIWELREGQGHLLHSRLMCWVAIDRALRLARRRSLPAPLARWTRERDLIAADIWTAFRHPTRGHFVGRRGGERVDAALLMMPLVRFVSATDPVWLDTLEALRAELVDDERVHRYREEDGLPGREGAFTACTFWYVECLARAGRLDDARLAMAKGLRLANHLGLFAEEADARGEPLGNFPQALTHLAFISAAHFLDRRLSDPSGGEWQP